MPTSLTGNKISQTYPQIIHVDGGVTGTAKALYDGDGTATVLKVSTSEVEISGNLTIAGTLTNVNTTNLQVDDSLIQLGRDNNSSDVVDIGFVGLYDAGGTDKYAGLFRDANDSGKFKLFIDSQEDLSTTNTINTSATGYTVATLVANLEAATVNIDGGNIDGTTIATSDITVGTGKTLNVSGGTLTLANDQISGDAINGGTIGSVTISQLAGALDANNQAITNVDINSGAIDGTNITVGSGKTLDVSAGTLTLADNQISGDKVEGGTIASITITSVDINGGTIDGANIAGGTGAFTTLTASGDVNFDSNTLFVDASQNNVGIGTNSITSTSQLQVQADKAELRIKGTNDSASDEIAHLILEASTDRRAGITIEGDSNDIQAFIGRPYDTANTLVFETDATEAMRIDSSGRVGIANDTPSDFDADGDDLVIGNSSGNRGLTVRSSASGYGSMYFAMGTSTTAQKVDGFLVYDHGTGFSGTSGLHIGTAASTRMIINESGEVQVQGASGGNLRIVRNDTTTTNGETLGRLLFSSTDGGIDTADASAVIEAIATEDFGTGNKGAKLEFSVKPNADDVDHNDHLAMTIEQDQSTTFSGQIKGVDGSASAPSYAFTNNTDMGMYRGASNTLRFATGGTERIEVQSSQTKISTPLKVVGSMTTDITSNNTGHDFRLNADTGFVNSIDSNFDGASAGSSYMRFKVASGSGSQTTVMDLKGDGNVGIGTTSPTGAKLQIDSVQSGDIGIQVTQSQAEPGIFIDQNGNNRGLKVESTGSNNGAAIFSSNCGSSTTDPLVKMETENSAYDQPVLQLVQAGSSNALEIVTSANGARAVEIINSDSSMTSSDELMRLRVTGTSSPSNPRLIGFEDSNSQLGGIVATSGTTVEYSTSSDYRLKENEKLITDGLERVNKLKPYKFNFKILPDKIVDGFFAHEVAEVVPEAVTGEKDAMKVHDVTDKEVIDAQLLNVSRLIPILVASVQELSVKVEQLEKKCEDCC